MPAKANGAGRVLAGAAQCLRADCPVTACPELSGCRFGVAQRRGSAGEMSLAGRLRGAAPPPAGAGDSADLASGNLERLRDCAVTGLVVVVGRGVHSRGRRGATMRSALRLEVEDLCNALQVRKDSLLPLSLTAAVLTLRGQSLLESGQLVPVLFAGALHNQCGGRSAGCPQVRCEEVPRNPGRLHVPRAELLAYAAQLSGPSEGRAMMRRMAVRLLALLAVATSAVQLAGDDSIRAAAAALSEIAGA